MSFLVAIKLPLLNSISNVSYKYASVTTYSIPKNVHAYNIFMYKSI